MRKFNLYTFFKSDGSIQLLYGTSPDDALDNAGLSTAQIAEEIQDFRKGYDTSLKFVNGKWQSKESKNNIPIHELHQN
jgi:hypothetical protein